MRLGVLIVRIDKFNFEKRQGQEQSNENQPDSTIRFSKPEIPEYDLKTDEILITATTQIDYEQPKFVTSAEVTGIFSVDKKYGNVVGSKDNSNLELVKELTNKIFPILAAKFRVYTGLFSSEVNSFSVIPEMKTELSNLQKVDKK
ncbi:hypothetical protein [Secundilactobacillus yichangensis]|uniref:hypothetical protein n=1 Tax=Secundilactobacillus yichangensis TaxID=2799580 RepID=UPI001942EF57|nr:hypothetical protein [Secundilactobacillus yichangensis]